MNKWCIGKRLNMEAYSAGTLFRIHLTALLINSVVTNCDLLTQNLLEDDKRPSSF